MINELTLTCFAISILASFGIAVAFVEKGDEWPVSPIRDKITILLSLVSFRATAVFNCTVCLSFWAALVADVALLLITGGKYFLWPLSGFAVLGLSWLIYELLSVLDKTEYVEENIEEEAGYESIDDVVELEDQGETNLN